LVEDIELSGVNILDSARITPQPWLKPLIVDSISSNPKPALLLTGEMEGRRIAVLSFSLSHSDLPLQVAFPLLISKLTAWLAPGASGIIPPSISPGSPVNLSGLFRDSAGTIQQVAVTRPDGSTAQLSIPQNGEVIFSDTSQLGIYQVSTGQDESLLFTVNMFSPAESRIAPGAPPAIAGLAPGSAAESSQSAKKEWWRWIASLALLILLAEWLIYHRATLVRIIQWVQRIPESSRSITK
jgi:Ca-activated chloride channel family protein